MDYVHIGCNPALEPCLPAGSNDTLQTIECRVFRNQILRSYPAPVNGILRIKVEHHDFGNYKEIVAYFKDQESMTWAYNIESDRLDKLALWDETSILELPPEYRAELAKLTTENSKLQ